MIRCHSRPFLLAALFTLVLLCSTSLQAQEIPISKTPSAEYLASRNLEQKPNDVGDVMAMYEVAMISRLCEGAELRAEMGKDASACAKSLYLIRKKCSAEYQSKFPRGDNEKVGNRLDHQSFAIGFSQCLKGELRSAK